MTAAFDLSAFTPHALRDSVLNEVHARPFTPLTQPVLVIRFAFMARGDSAVSDSARRRSASSVARSPWPSATA